MFVDTSFVDTGFDFLIQSYVLFYNFAAPLTVIAVIINKEN